MAMWENDRKFDLRTVDRHVRMNVTNREEHEQYLAALPDVSHKIRPKSEGGDDDGFETRGQPKRIAPEPSLQPPAANVGRSAETGRPEPDLSEPPPDFAAPPREPVAAPPTPVAAGNQETGQEPFPVPESPPPSTTPPSFSSPPPDTAAPSSSPPESVSPGTAAPTSEPQPSSDPWADTGVDDVIGRPVAPNAPASETSESPEESEGEEPSSS